MSGKMRFISAVGLVAMVMSLFTGLVGRAEAAPISSPVLEQTAVAPAFVNAAPDLHPSTDHGCENSPFWVGFRSWGVYFDDCNVHWLIELFKRVAAGGGGVPGWEQLGALFGWNPIGAAVGVLGVLQHLGADRLEELDRRCDHRGIVISQYWGRDWRPVVRCP